MDREEIPHIVEGKKVLISHYVEREGVCDTLWVEQHVDIVEGMLTDLFGKPCARIGVNILLFTHYFD